MVRPGSRASPSSRGMGAKLGRWKRGAGSIRRGSGHSRAAHHDSTRSAGRSRRTRSRGRCCRGAAPSAFHDHPMIVALDVTPRVAAAIRDVPDFPKPGIMFKDITPVLLDASLFRDATDAMAAPFARDGISHVVAIESRGFILVAPVAHALG